MVESSDGIRMISSSQQLLVDTYVYLISKLSFKIILEITKKESRKLYFLFQKLEIFQKSSQIDSKIRKLNLSVITGYLHGVEETVRRAGSNHCRSSLGRRRAMPGRVCCPVRNWRRPPAAAACFSSSVMLTSH